MVLVFQENNPYACGFILSYVRSISLLLSSKARYRQSDFTVTLPKKRPPTATDRHKSSMSQGTHPAIVDADTWEAVQELNGRAKEKVANQREHQKTLFSGLLVCADYGAPMLGACGMHTRKRSSKSVTYIHF